MAWSKKSFYSCNSIHLHAKNKLLRKQYWLSCVTKMSLIKKQTTLRQIQQFFPTTVSKLLQDLSLLTIFTKPFWISLLQWLERKKKKKRKKREKPWMESEELYLVSFAKPHLLKAPEDSLPSSPSILYSTRHSLWE